MTTRSPRAGVAAASAATIGVVALSALIYTAALGRAPVYLGWDEARFAAEAHAIAATGRDMTGARMPLFFYNIDPLATGHDTHVWWQPFQIYLTAAVFRVAPVAEWSTRLPIVGLALLNILLAGVIGRRMFHGEWYGPLAAAFLALVPAHFLFGRQAMDYFCPLPFALAWLWCVDRCLSAPAGMWWPAAAGAVLGAGVYSYVSSWLVMPFYWLVTAIALWRGGRRRAIVALAAGSALPLLLLIPWLWLHPRMPSEMLQGYGAGIKASFADRVTLYWDYFNPSYLFFSGGSEWMWATRQAGVLPLAFAVLLPCGIWSVCRRGAPMIRRLLLVGFFFVPMPIVLTLPEAPAYATARALLAIPFGTLIAVAGVEWLIERRHRAARWFAAALAISIPLQFVPFARNYFGPYQQVSAFRYDALNLGAVADAVIRSDADAPLPHVYLGQDLTTGEAVQWLFHLVKRGREDLYARTRYFSVAAFNPRGVEPGSLLIVDAGNAALARMLGANACSVVQVVMGAGGAPASAILRRN